ncbi:fasciclin domain-containing protein [soil metagenome]
MVRFALRSVLAAATLSLVACGGGEATGGAPVQDPTTAGAVSSAAKSDIVDTANAAGSFKTLLAAVKAADLEGTLRSPGPFTVFAPTDEAFAKLPAGTVEGLLKPENKDKLKAILTYHVVSGNVGAAQAMKLSTAKTVNGKELKLDASSGSLHVGKATVVKADVQASNGVIHVVDAVLLPE